MSLARPAAAERAALCVVFFTVPLITLFAPQGFHVVMPLAVMVAWGARLSGGELRLPSRRSLAVAFGLFAYGVVSLAWSVAPGASFARAAQVSGMLALVLVLIALARTVPGGMGHAVLRALSAGLALGLALSCLELWTEGLIYNGIRDSDQFHAYIVNRPVAIQTLFVWPVAGFLVLSGHPVMAGALVVLALATAAWSASSAALLAMLVGLAVLAAAHLRPRGTGLALGIAVAAYALLAPVLGLYLDDLLPAVLTDAIDPRAGRARLEIWEAISARALERPVLGWGLDAIDGMTFPSIEWLYSDRRIPHPHNAVLQVWLDCGLLGALALAVAGFAAFRRAANLPAAMRPFALAGMAAALVDLMTSWTLWAAWWLATLGALAAALVLLANFARSRQSAAGG